MYSDYKNILRLSFLAILLSWIHKIINLEKESSLLNLEIMLNIYTKKYKYLFVNTIYEKIFNTKDILKISYCINNDLCKNRNKEYNIHNYQSILLFHIVCDSIRLENIDKIIITDKIVLNKIINHYNDELVDYYKKFRTKTGIYYSLVLTKKFH
jgi:hypothetical protein